MMTMRMKNSDLIKEEEGESNQSKSEHECREAFAYHSQRVSGSFGHMGRFVRGNNLYSWGWSNGPLASSIYGYSLDFVTYHGSDEEDRLTHGKTIGSLTLEYTGKEATLVLGAGKHLWLSKTYACVGEGRLPQMGVGNDLVETVDPSTFPLAQTQPQVGTTFNVGNLEDRPVHVVAYAVICGDFAAHDEAVERPELKNGHNVRGGISQEVEPNWFSSLVSTVFDIVHKLQG